MAWDSAALREEVEELFAPPAHKSMTFKTKRKGPLGKPEIHRCKMCKGIFEKKGKGWRKKFCTENCRASWFTKMAGYKRARENYEHRRWREEVQGGEHQQGAVDGGAGRDGEAGEVHVFSRRLP